ncbi:hypothetical protein [Emcibacter sp.]|uniref:hypothetical protein n=1 Tax=Emcibacter sp. TaxID=1979954 RepID=UPI002AA8DCCF|nr:hypothetical protein [Emcibacter sp.]
MENLLHYAGLAFIPFLLLSVIWGIRDIFQAAPRIIPAKGFLPKGTSPLSDTNLCSA